ncbi:MAG: hypothetical protein RMJ00_07160 [Nitrososphaerota archaeon]|nr:hypothetical protein [Candidatus Bathyarchaeota archaeon]MDW8062459.1 hypothetical protein [Nitrososphaerota archaeon]
MSEMDVYSEGERIAKLAVEKNVAREQLRNIAIYAKSEGANAVRYLIRRQVSRNRMPFEFGKEIERLSNMVDPSIFSKMMLIAYDLYNWSKYEPIASTLFRHIESIGSLVQVYASREQLGEAKISIRFKKEGGMQLEVTFDKSLRRPPKEVASFIERSIREKIANLKNVPFEIWIGRKEE